MEEELKKLEEQMRSVTLLFSSSNIAERQRGSIEMLRLKAKHDNLIKLMAKEKWNDEDENLPPGWDMKDFKTVEIPPEHKVSLGATFKYLEDFAKKEEELEKLEEQIEEVKESLENAEYHDDLEIEHMQLDELVIRRNRLKESLGIKAPPQSVYDKDYAEQLKKDFEPTTDYSKTRDDLDAENKRILKEKYAKIGEEQRKRDDILRNGDYESKRAVLEKEKFERDLEERKRMYNASGRGIDFNKERTDEEEDERMRSLSLMKCGAHLDSPYHDVAGVYLPSAFGADIEAEQVFQYELHGIVDDMKVKLVDEKKILEGTLNPEYGKGEWRVMHIERVEGDIFQKEPTWPYAGPQDMEYGKGEWKNELSQSNHVEEQWKSDSRNGFSTTDLTPISIPDSSSSSFTVEESSPSFPTVLLRRQSTTLLDGSWVARPVVSGAETVVMSASFECMEQTINVPMAGMLNEER